MFDHYLFLTFAYRFPQLGFVGALRCIFDHQPTQIPGLDGFPTSFYLQVLYQYLTRSFYAALHSQLETPSENT